MDNLDANWKDAAGIFIFHCDFAHFFRVDASKRPPGDPIWTWDGNRESPTFNPSLLVTIPADEGFPAVRCHSFVRAGAIQFLTDCTHQLAGQTVPLQRWDDGANVDPPPSA